MHRLAYTSSEIDDDGDEENDFTPHLVHTIKTKSNLSYSFALQSNISVGTAGIFSVQNQKKTIV